MIPERWNEIKKQMIAQSFQGIHQRLQELEEYLGNLAELALADSYGDWIADEQEAPNGKPNSS